MSTFPLAGLHFLLVTPEIAPGVCPVSQTECPGTEDAGCRCMQLSNELTYAGATVHLAHGHHDALGKAWLLYSRNLYPRAIISSWCLTRPGTSAWILAQALGNRLAGTCHGLLRNIAQMDPDATAIVTAEDREDVVMPEGLRDAHTIRHPVSAHDIVSVLEVDRLRRSSRPTLIREIPSMQLATEHLRRDQAHRQKVLSALVTGYQQLESAFAETRKFAALSA